MHDTEWQTFTAVIGHHVRRAREVVGWSQEELAKAAHTSQGTVSRLERGDGVDGTSVFRCLATLGGVVTSEVNGALPPSLLEAFEWTRRILRLPDALAVPDPAFATLLRTYHTLTPAQRATLLRIVQPIVSLLAEGSQ